MEKNIRVNVPETVLIEQMREVKEPQAEEATISTIPARQIQSNQTAERSSRRF
jgi:hypothetical protein